MAVFRINFTKQYINNINPPKLLEGKRVASDTYHDKNHKGLILLVSNGGAKTFYLYTKVQGKPERVKIGRFPDVTIEQARKLAHKYKGEIVQGINPNKKKSILRNETTLKEFFALYIKRYATGHKAKETVEGDIRQYKNFLPKLQNKKLSNITQDNLIELHYYIKNNHGLYSANKLVAFVKAIFNKAIEWGWEGKNPAQGIKMFREKSRERFLQVDEFPRFWDAVMQEENTIIRDYIIISLLTGARKSNVVSMFWDNVHLERKQWYIPETKNGESLTIPLPQLAITILTVRKENATNKWVFPSFTSRSGHLEEPKRAWKRILKHADIKDLRIHDLRRTLGSWQAATGATTAIIGKSLGHKNKNTTAIYERLNLDPVKQAVERATDAMIETFGTEENIIEKLKLVSMKVT